MQSTRKTVFASLGIFIALIIGVIVFNTTIPADTPYVTTANNAHPVWGENGMVSSAHYLATDVGVTILKQGGNAIDAAVAVGYALAVTYPQAGNIGGGGFMMIHLADSGKTIAIDYREMAPAKAHTDIFLDENGDVDRVKALFHGLSTAVPGSVMGMELALKKYGTMELKQVMQGAIQLAEKGFLVSKKLSKALKNYSKRLKKWPSTTAIFYKPNGDPYEAGETLIQDDLANSLKIIAAHGSKGFYQGDIANKIATAVQKAGGLITTDDLANYKAVIRTAVSTNYRGFDVMSMPPPSSGGIHLIQLLNILENSPIGDMGHNSVATIHQMVEAMKYVFADRSEYLADPDFYQVPTKILTSKVYAKHIFEQINPQQARPSVSIKPGNLAPYESDQTTHYSVADRWGNAVSTTTTLNFSFGSGLVATGTGILMNNEMDDFSAKAGSPNGFNLLGGKANAIEAHKRPLSSMTPTIVLKDGKPFLLTGTSGGGRIITTTLQIIMNVIDHKMNIAEASHAIRIHHQWFPDVIRIEKGLAPDTINLLQSKGHRLVVKSPMGSTQSIMITTKGLLGAADPRPQDVKAAGY